ncbi:LruC domain-containing protein [Bacteroides timonensis]|uniref:LruC domain-containing protein n=1 Tax=Bacteroides timonensis TaxID=1470345 RepID=UPI000693285C|nr:LruC domain-containing protein [Bacteroides timonensis]
MRKNMLGMMMLITILAFVISSCTDKDVYQGPKEANKEFNEFDYETVQNEVNLEVSYLNSEVQANVYFELYDEMPVTPGEYNYIKRDDVSPLFTAYTADNSVFNGTVELPAYVKKVYVYTPAFFAQTLIEAEVVNGVIKATDGATDANTRTVSSTSQEYNSYMLTEENTPNEYNDTRWKGWLGSYDKYKNGEINYTYQGKLAAQETDGLYTAHTRVINAETSCPKEYRSYSDMYLNETAEVAVTFLGQNTCWNCSMGYYYYKEGENPQDPKDAHVIMLFPNTQDGQWGRDPQKAAPTAGINRLTSVQLKYYPNIAQGSMEGETNAFPSGYRIGFVIANNAWSNRIQGYTGNNKYRAATSEGLSIKNQGTNFNSPRTAVYRYGDWVMISFEDYTTDENFSDVVITLKSNPVDAITNIPEVDPDNDKTTVQPSLKGTFAFEDLWPSQGDYDMNDVMVRYSYGKTFDINNKIYSETFVFKTFANVASNNNGLAFKLTTNGTVSSATFAVCKAGETEFKEEKLQYEATDNVYILTDNVKSNMGGEYKITVNYEKESPATRQSGAEAFIFKNEDNGKRWEVHLPKRKPTSKMETSYFGTGDDASKPEKDIYYVRNGSYPFAIFLSGADENSLSKMLDKANEKTAVEQLYSGYSGWVESNGTQNQDWYKK